MQISLGALSLVSNIIGFSRTMAPLRLAATRGEAATTTQASSAGRERLTSRTKHRVGGSALTSLCAGWSNYYISGARVETNNGNAVTLKAHFEIVGAPTPVVTATFAGASSISMAAGKDLQLCDEISPTAFGLSSFAAGTDVFIVTEISVTAAPLTFLRSVNAEAGVGESGTFGPLNESAIGVAGALTLPTGGAATSTLFYPACVLGRHVTPTPSAIIFGSSLVAGQTDSPGFGLAGGGFYVRGLYNVGSGRAVAWSRQAVGGTSALQASTNFTKQAMVWAYATHFICELGSNDGSGGQTAANTRTKLRTIWAAAHAAGIQHIEQQLCINRCPTSSDSWATAANMTPLAGFETAGAFKDPLNALVVGNVGANSLDAYLDVSAQWADATLTDRVKGGYSNDGTHPNTTSAPLMAASVATRAASWTAT